MMRTPFQQLHGYTGSYIGINKYGVYTRNCTLKPYGTHEHILCDRSKFIA